MYLFVVLALMVSCLAFTCCKKTPEEKYVNIEVDKTELILAYTDTEMQFNIIYTGDWGIKAKDLEQALGPNLAVFRDLTITPVYGTSNKSVTISFTSEPTENYELMLTVDGEKSSVGVLLKIITAD
jgi:hypothetical protein